MLILRVLVLLAVISIGVAALAWILTGNRRYLRAAWRIFQVVLALSLLLLGLLFFERFLVML